MSCIIKWCVVEAIAVFTLSDETRRMKFSSVWASFDSVNSEMMQVFTDGTNSVHFYRLTSSVSVKTVKTVLQKGMSGLNGFMRLKRFLRLKRWTKLDE